MKTTDKKKARPMKHRGTKKSRRPALDMPAIVGRVPRPKQKVQHLTQSNPNFYKLLLQDNLVCDDAEESQEHTVNSVDDDDDKMALHYEKLLGLNKNKSRAAKKQIFEEEGLEDLFDLTSSWQNDTDSRTATITKKNTRIVKEHIAQPKDEASDTHSNNGDDAVELVDPSLDFSVSQHQKELLQENRPDLPISKYIAPHLRQAQKVNQDTIDMIDPRIRRKLQGLINRLSESNMDSILIEIEAMYMAHPRHDMTVLITQQIIQLISFSTNLLDSFVNVYAALLTCIAIGSGQEISAHFVQVLTEAFLRQYDLRNTTIKSESDDKNEIIAIAEQSDKQCNNLLVLIAMLYNFQVISCVMMYDIVRLFMTSLNEFDVELLMKLLKLGGSQMRIDDPNALKDILTDLKQIVAKRSADGGSQRLRFMLEAIYDLKNNKRKRDSYFQTFDGMSLTKFISNFCKRRDKGSLQPLQVTLEDIRNAHTKGKWWLVGSAWIRNQAHSNTHSVEENQSNSIKSATQAGLDLFRLAKAQNMNTDVRRSIFVAIVSSEDYLDAFEKVLKLGLHEKQQREIVRVLVHCASNERSPNPFYSLLAEKFCHHAHAFKITFQYTLWDFVNLTPAPPLRQTINVARLYGHLLATGAISILALKGISFTTLLKHQIDFVQVVLVYVLLPLQEQTVRQIFGVGDSAKAGLSSVLERIRLFLVEYTNGGKDLINLIPTNHSTILRKNIKVLRQCLSLDDGHERIEIKI